MKGIYRGDGYYDGSMELSASGGVHFNRRRCVRCGGGRGEDFVQSNRTRMRIRTGIVFWNLMFSMMFTCVKGK